MAGSVHRVADVADVAVIWLGAWFGLLRVDGETINPSAMRSLTRAAADRLGD